ncbi:hypothetical protein [Rhizobium lusitanum]|uniref:Methyltransferase n=1 Tax=Rhizobium lusitanum TaxID=293958 RepID=A0A1C3VRQ0_9HYPH|nr:hypothetical protein [Rhizobium lusitanum]SCB30470.1 hypothetical protein GA0061101_106113 [Rhizobium lusitanum]
MTVVASKYARKENDLYQTEPWATEAALRHFDLSGLRGWEPAAGNHLVADVIREHGAEVYTSDIVTYDRRHDLICDFLKPHDSVEQFDFIFTNPPYGPQNRDAARFARLALQRCDGWVFILCTMKFDSGKTRTDLFRDNPRFHAKIVLIDRISWEMNGKSGTEDHAWYIWQPTDAADLGSAPARIFWEGRGA